MWASQPFFTCATEHESSLGDALSLMSIYTRSDESQPLRARDTLTLLGSEIPVVTLGNELPRVLIVAIPRGLRTCKRSREAVSASLEIEDCVDSL